MGPHAAGCESSVCCLVIFFMSCSRNLLGVTGVSPRSTRQLLRDDEAVHHTNVHHMVKHFLVPLHGFM